MPESMSRKSSVALTSLLVSAGLAAGKFAAGLVTGSLALLSEAAHGLADVGATAITFWAVRLSERPPDEDHPYGHGKIESVAALGATALLLAAAGWIGTMAVGRLLAGEHTMAMHLTPVALGVLATSVGVDFWRARSLARVARETGSPALAADALHFYSDMLGSSVALAGLVVVALGFPQADTVAALAVAGFVLLAGLRLGRRTIDVLVDTAPTGAAALVRRAIKLVPGVARVERVRVRPVGAPCMSKRRSP
jgi:cation diffusion facilitator family transporter